MCLVWRRLWPLWDCGKRGGGCVVALGLRAREGREGRARGEADGRRRGGGEEKSAVAARDALLHLAIT